jgi:hypothetical protein
MAEAPGSQLHAAGGGVMLPLISERARKRRINRIIRELEGYETAMRDRCAQLMELAEPGDDLHVEVRRLVEALDG